MMIAITFADHFRIKNDYKHHLFLSAVVFSSPRAVSFFNYFYQMLLIT